MTNVKSVKMSLKKKPQPLTLKELKVLEFVEGFMHEQAVAPTFQEIKEHFGFASFNSVQRYLKQLQDKNYIYIPKGNQKRALQVLHPSRSLSNLLADRIPDTSASSTTQYPFPTQLKKETPSMAGSPPSQVESLSLPLLGRVAAGLPIESFLNDEHIDVPASMVRNPAKTFALIVQGKSMIEDGILDGDIIFVQKQTYANNGDTVVAMVNEAATVKRFYLHHKSKDDIHSNPQTLAHSNQKHPPGTTNEVELRPANETMDSMWYPPAMVDIQGVVVGLMRRF
jgi:repressor LexA